MTCTASGVTEHYFFFLFFGCLLINTESDLVYPELPLASGPRVQSISSELHKALFQPVLGTLIFTCPRETFTGKNRLSANS